jgi:hypothetical protein
MTILCKFLSKLLAEWVYSELKNLIIIHSLFIIHY